MRPEYDVHFDIVFIASEYHLLDSQQVLITNVFLLRHIYQHIV